MKKILIPVKELRCYSEDKIQLSEGFLQESDKNLFLERPSRLHKKNGVVGIDRKQTGQWREFCGNPGERECL